MNDLKGNVKEIEETVFDKPESSKKMKKFLEYSTHYDTQGRKTFKSETVYSLPFVNESKKYYQYDKQGLYSKIIQQKTILLDKGFIECDYQRNIIKIRQEGDTFLSFETCAKSDKSNHYVVNSDLKTIEINNNTQDCKEEQQEEKPELYCKYYKFDAVGNWSECKMFDNKTNELVLVNQRKIKYHN